MGCGASVRVNLRTKKEDPKTIAEPVIQYGTYQFHKNAMFSETHNLYVVDPGPLEYMPPPHVPPTRKNEIFDLEEYKFLDKRVFDLPEEKRKGSLVKLVKYLVKPCKDDIGKVRVLFTYLASRNMEKFVMPLQPPKEHSVVWYLARLKNRKNNHAQFFSFMCRIAGVPCVVIHGYLKGSTYRIGQSVEKNKAPLYGEWNAVLVDQTWRLCNVFWSACAVGTDVGEKVERTYNVDETYFLADPEQLVYSHFPEEYMWQLTGRPLGIKSFEKRAFVKERFFELGLRLLSHPSCYITTETGDIEIDFGLDSDRVMDIKLKCLVFYSDFNDWHLQEDGRYQHDMIYNPNNQSVAIKIRFPRKGTYKVEIIGKDETNTDTNYIFDWVAVYKVRVNEIKSKYIAFPKVGDAGWGNNRAMVEHEIRPLSHTHAVIYAEGEWIEVTLSIDKDENRGLEICYKLTDLHKDLSRLSFNRKGVSEEPDQYVIRFQPPKDEEAGLCIYMKVDDDVINLINYLVINSQIADANLADDIEIVRLELQAAIDDMHMAAMERAVDLCETKGYDEALRRETTIARDLIKRFKLLYVQKHDALALENPMIQDIKNMSSPKHEVHEVIKAVLLLLGNFEEETRVWTNCQEQLGLTERNSLRNRINVFDLDDLGLDIALGAKKIIDRVDIEVLSSHCPAAAVLYYWVQGNVEEKIKRNPEEAKQTVPRTHELGGPGAPMYKIHKPLGKITLALV